jgi:FtsX-like permease family
VNGRVLRVAWYRFRATLGRRWGGYLSLALVIGLAGGVALGTAAAARRTESSFPVFLASTNPSDLTVQFAANSYAGLPAFAREVARLPQVRRAGIAVEPIADVLGRDGGPTAASRAANFGVEPVGSVNGLYFTQDRVAVIGGRMADPRRRDEVMVSAQAARLLGLHLGETVPLGFYTTAQSESPLWGTPRVRPTVRITARIVGLAEFSNTVVQDDIGRPLGYLLLTPALTRVLVAAGTSSGFSFYGLQLRGGARDVAAVEREIDSGLPVLGAAQFHVTSVNEAQAQSVIEPDAIALAAFAVIAALATLLIAGQAIARLVRAGDGDRQVLRALGAGPALAAADGLAGILGAVAAGSLLAVGVAVALSPVAPIGPVRPVYPSPGFAADWTVLGLGVLALSGVLGAVAMALAARAARRGAGPAARGGAGARGSAAGRLAARSGLPTPAVAGLVFAFGRGQAGQPVPARSAISGTVLAVVLVAATLTFGSSLATLVSHPPLYGWNWSYALSATQGIGAIPQQQVGRSLRGDPDVAAWTTVSLVTADLDGLAVPVLLGRPRAAVAPLVLSGRPVTGPGQIVLGPATLAQLHRHLGDPVILRYGNVIRARLIIVGTATLPAVGLPQGLHPSMGTGALAPDQLLPARATGCSGPPGLAFVRLRAGVSAAVGLASLSRAVSGANRALAAAPASDPCHGDVLSVLPVQHPAQIANYRTMGATPALLAFSLAAAAAAALGLTLFASVRRRRRDLAVLKTIGFTQRQLAATVAWQATAAAVIGIAVGVPLGIALGRWLWTLFARQIYVVPEPTVPAGPVILLCLGTLVLVNLVAAVPGRAAARTPTALALHAE